jgi:phenylacetate-CoA ligase
VIDSLLIEQRLRRSIDASPGAVKRLATTAGLAAIAMTERAIPFWPLSAVEQLQRRRLQDVMRHAHATVPHYREAMDALGLRPEDVVTPEDLTALPLIDAHDVATAPLRFVAAPYRERGREVFNTSGSTLGVRKPIFWDHASLLLRPARAERDRVVLARLAGERWSHVMAREFLTNERRRTLARLAGIATEDHQRLLILPADFASRTQRAINSERSVIPRRAVHYHHLPPTAPFDVAAAHLDAIRPRIVFSFGSYADQFFRFVEGTGTRVHLPKLWVYLGDMVSPDGRAIAEGLGCPLYSVYSAKEASSIGFQCERREGFHLNVDLCAVRLVDEAGCGVPAGVPGEVVISALDNRATVLLNYRLGDRAVLSSEPCPCGRSLPILAGLEGRRSEIVTLGDGREVSSVTLEALFRLQLRRTVQAQLEQHSPGRLRWRIVPAAGVDHRELEAALLARAREVLGTSAALSVEIVDGIARTDAGKFVRTRRAAAVTP